MSTELYLEALRATDYLLFLEWPEYITQLYLGKNAMQDADTTVSLIVFEWMHCGFSDLDMKHMAIIDALSCQHDGLFESHLSYAATALVAAALQCLAYKNQGFVYPQLEDRSAEKVFLCIQELESMADSQKNSQQLSHEEAALKQLANNHQQLVYAAKIKISFMLNLQDYIQYLKTITEKDIDYQLRLGLVSALYSYLRNKFTILTKEVKNQIQDYIIKLRKLSTSAEEQKILANLSPFPEESNLIWDTVQWGLRLFLPTNPDSNILRDRTEQDENASMGL